jgi:hydroxymethylglutaryl-CoA reductase
VQIVGTKDPESSAAKIMEIKERLLEIANEKDPGLAAHGGGARDVSANVIETVRGRMIIVILEVDVRDAMGANAVNTMCEAIAPEIEKSAGGRARLRIVTNLATKRLAYAKAVWKKDSIGEDAVEGVLDAYAFAKADQQRCATHNKGIMNGIDAVALATAQDFRALEAAAHSYACIDGRYKPLSRYWKDENGDLAGDIELPVAVGTVGGASKTSPVARVALKVLGLKSSQEFSQVLAAVGLAQNFAALKALSTAGIQSGHMRLHAKNIAVMAGAAGDMIDEIAGRMEAEKNINVSRAKESLDLLRASRRGEKI